MITCIKNANLIREDEVRRASVTFGGRILEIDGELSADSYIDGGGLYLSPGFIDVHTHGCAGMSAADGAESVRAIARNMPRGGVTAFLPTTSAAPPESIRNSMRGIAEAMGAPVHNGARVLGAHMEGPYLSAAYKGAHEAAMLSDPELALTEEFAGVIRLVTIAPELRGAEEYIRGCARLGIRVSIGHTGADYELCAEAVKWGAVSFTHTYNAMSPLGHRSPGAVGAAMTLENTFCELIADNRHVSVPAQTALFRAAGADRLILVSDSQPPALTDTDREFIFGNRSARVTDGVVCLTDGTIAGSVLTLNRAVWNLHKNTGAPLPQAVGCASRNPARMLGLDGLGAVLPGYAADLVLLDESFDVVTTIADGRIVYSRPQIR